MTVPDPKELYTYDPEELGLRLDEMIQVLKEFRQSLPKEIGKSGKVSRAEVAYIQAILNVIDYVEVPEYINHDISGEA